jgi:hypothetical protein
MFIDTQVIVVKIIWGGGGGGGGGFSPFSPIAFHADKRWRIGKMRLLSNMGRGCGIHSQNIFVFLSLLA